MSRGRGLFLDRDGTLVWPRHYPSRPEELVLYEGIERELRLLHEAEFQLVLITNQSGIARGLFTEADLARMHDYLASELGRHGVEFAAVYYCPHHPEGSLGELAVACSCRKPEPGMLVRAAAELALDLERSWMIGDILDDVEAGRRAGCRTVLVDLGTEPASTAPSRRPDYVARDTRHALQIVAALERLGPPVTLDYLPTSWRQEADVRAAAVAGARGGTDAHSG